MSSRFEERLAPGPVVVGDGGMGVLITSAVPRLRCPEEANLRAPESVVTLHTSFIRAGADLIETNTFGANRQQAGAALPRGRARADQRRRASSSRARRARSRAGRSSSPARSGRSATLDSLAADQRAEVFAEQAAILDGRGVDLFMVETFYDLDELETAIEAVRSVSLAADRRDAHLRRGRRDAGRRDRGRRGRAAAPARPRRDRREPRRRACTRRSRRSRRWAPTTARRSRRCRTSASRASPAAASSTRTRRPSTSPSSPRTPRSSARA